MMILNNNNM